MNLRGREMINRLGKQKNTFVLHKTILMTFLFVNCWIGLHLEVQIKQCKTVVEMATMHVHNAVWDLGSQVDKASL